MILVDAVSGWSVIFADAVLDGYEAFMDDVCGIELIAFTHNT